MLAAVAWFLLAFLGMPGPTRLIVIILLAVGLPVIIVLRARSSRIKKFTEQLPGALDVVNRVKARLAELAPSLPPGVRVVTTYDRTDLIHRSIATLYRTLIEEFSALPGWKSPYSQALARESD